jgi:predicted DsbA family dithiol-disulfide isomerase
VRLAQHMAIASERVRAECIEVTEFPELAQRYSVMAVPKIVINDKLGFEGAVPEKEFLGAVLQAVDGKGSGTQGAPA